MSFTGRTQNASEVNRTRLNSTVTVTTDKGIGSGFFIEPSLIVTNYHVIEGATRATCNLSNKVVEYDILGYVAKDEQTDLVILKVKGLKGSPVPIASEEIGIDQGVFAFDNPFNENAKFNSGTVSGERIINEHTFFEIKTTVAPGSSGGPLLNIDGELIGVTVMSIVEGEKLNLVVPNSKLQGLLSDKKMNPVPLYQASLSKSEQEPSEFGSVVFHVNDKNIGVVDLFLEDRFVGSIKGHYPKKHFIPECGETNSACLSFELPVGSYDYVAKSKVKTWTGTIDVAKDNCDKVNLKVQYKHDPGCFNTLEKIFEGRGAYPVPDEWHRNVVISFFEGVDSYCISGKVRVEDGTIASVFLQYNDNTYDSYDHKFFNVDNQPPTISNGISEMIYSDNGEEFRIVFIDYLKPEPKKYKIASVPLSCPLDCYTCMSYEFEMRGSTRIEDGMHRNVIVSFFDYDMNSTCVSGKARLENGEIVSIFLQYIDGTYELMETKFFNENKRTPEIDNGITEMIHTAKGEMFKIIFIDNLNPDQSFRYWRP